MKPSKKWSLYCVDPTKIEGYDRAVNDKSDTVYHSHHRLEIDLHLSREELIEWGLYYNRQPAELLILTAREHLQLHRETEGCNTYATEKEAKRAAAQQTKKWKQAHSDKQNAASRRWQKSNPEYWNHYQKVYSWIKAHPGSTDFPKRWDENDISVFNELSRKGE